MNEGYGHIFTCPAHGVKSKDATRMPAKNSCFIKTLLLLCSAPHAYEAFCRAFAAKLFFSSHMRRNRIKTASAPYNPGTPERRPRL